MIDLRLGDWRNALTDVDTCDALITDPPYSARTHGLQRSGTRVSNTRRGYANDGAECVTRALSYSAWTARDVEDFVASWSPRVRGWICVFASHDFAPVYAAAFARAGRYVFAPLACVLTGLNVRLTGDGPANWATYLVVARPRAMAHWRALRGAYVGTPGRPEGAQSIVVGSKPIWLMTSIIQDYSNPGDLVVDTCAGGATTLIAAARSGRRALGAELDVATYRAALQRIALGDAATCTGGEGAPRRPSTVRPQRARQAAK